ncbi:HEPN domain-containing protein [Archaeoglobus sp.]
MRDEVEVFLDRAKKFETAGEHFFKEGIYDLSAFHIEQAFQLYLKYILAKVIGYFPKTHSISRLFKDLSKINKKFYNFYKENEIILKDVEDAYILSRYFPREYSKEEVKKMLDVLKKFREEFKEWI